VSVAKICLVEPFRYQATPQPVGDQGASSNQINEQAIEDYLNRLRTAICDGIQAILDAGGGVTSFLELSDTPDTYAGQAGKVATVNGAENALVFSTPVESLTTFARLVMMWAGNHTTGRNFGEDAAETGTTTVTESTATAATLIASHARTVKTTAAGAGSTANSRATGTGFLVQISTVANVGGFRLVWRFGNTTARATVATQAMFVGLFNTGAAAGNVEPSTHLNVLLFGYDSTDANWQFMTNGAGAATKIDLGANFPIDTTSLYEATISSEPGGGAEVFYRLRNLSTGDEISGTTSTDLPATGLRFVPQIWIGNRTTAVSAGFAHIFMSLETGTP
jgi:hypothetical protein